ncbi:MAG: sulfotransferase domain-containing protein [Bacteroidota bacterium]
MKDTRSKSRVKVDAAARWFMWHFLQKTYGFILITEFPKSGGTWFGQMMSTALKVPFPRNKAPKLEPCIIHGHYNYSKRPDKMIAVLRDGRDTMVSAYHHFLFENDRNPSFSVVNYRKAMPFDDYENIRKNLPQFIEFMFTDYANRPRHFSWADFINQHLDKPNVLAVRYEDLLIDPSKELERAIGFLGYPEISRDELVKVADAYSFEKLAKRKPGQENNASFLRKGIAGDWKNHFSEEAREVFFKYAGKELIKAGYEKDNSWV